MGSQDDNVAFLRLFKSTEEEPFDWKTWTPPELSLDEWL